MPAFLDRNGQQQQVTIGVEAYRAAAENGQSLPEYLASQYQTDAARHGNVFDQMCASEGIYMRSDKSLGIRASTMKDVLVGKDSAGITTKDATPASRILFPAVFMQAVEDKLVANLSMTTAALETMIAYDEAIQGDRYEQPVINFAGPEAARAQGISQLAAPNSMVLITSSDKSYKIPTFSLGLEVADQALAASTLDLVALSLARQAAVQANERAQNYMYNLYNGDIDNAESSLATLGRVRAASSFDATSTGGILTQKAWTKWLVNNATKRTITHIVTDIDGALAIENRTGRPNVMGDNPTSPRINTMMEVINPLWPNQVKLFLTLDPNWPAGTIMGIDSSWAIRRVRSLTSDYQAVEAYVMRRTTAMRMDFGEHINRMYDEAFDVLTLT
jgi:hypothetical protein